MLYMSWSFEHYLMDEHHTLDGIMSLGDANFWFIINVGYTNIFCGLMILPYILTI